jgi:squalene synthase HpnC
MVKSARISVPAAYQYCATLAKTHYENFPVASFILPKEIRRPISVIYAFARQADDIADEGTASQEIRLQQLQHYWQALENLKSGIPPQEALFIALEDVLKKNPDLPISLFFNLLHAFKQDVVKNEYQNFQEILGYCRYSANPIGRLLLYLTHNASKENLLYADAVCSALQLINFLQDLKSDLLVRNRCYLPKDEMIALNISVTDLTSGKNSGVIQQLITKQLQRAEALLAEGATLTQRLTGLFGFEIRFIIAGGLQIIQALKKRKDVYARPTLKTWHLPLLLWHACKNV